MKATAPLATVERVSESYPAPRTLSGGFGLSALWTLYALTVRQHMHGKRWMVMGFLFLLPAGLALIVRATDPEVPKIELEFLAAFMFIPQVILPLVALIYTSGIIRDELEEQTLTYLLIRPIPKWAMYGTKLLAIVTTTVVLTTLFTALTYAAVYVGADPGGENIPLRCLKAIAFHSLAIASYCCLFGLIGLLTKWILVVGVIYVVVFEWILANFPVSLRLITVIYHTRLIAFRSMEFMTLGVRGPESMAAEVWQFDVKTDPNLLEHPQISTSLIVLLVGSFVCSVIAALICSQREFYVKTPEKS
jgi:ABC-2 type transport system permease protein